MTCAPIPLSEYLRGLGYAARPIPYPAVPRGKERVRIVMHAGNTEEEIEELIKNLLHWASGMKTMLRVAQVTESGTEA